MTGHAKRMFLYWGKAVPAGEPGPARHLLVYHLLDVAAVGAELLDRHPSLLRRFAGHLQLEEGAARRLVLWLLAHHDFGKFAAAFQRQRRDLFPEEIPDRYRYDVRHDTLGYLLWQDALPEVLFGKMGSSHRFDEFELENAVFALIRCAAGHHGRPPDHPEWKSTWFRPADLEAAEEASRELQGLVSGGLGPIRILDRSETARLDHAVARASWSLAGFAVLCDWIGSNRDWFPFHDRPMGLDAYWTRHALPQARRAVADAGVLPDAPAEGAGFHVLFPELPTPTDLQRAADSVTIGQGPTLFVVEDLTGSGKTEAALTLAARLLSARRAEGLYVALPTTATADAMYGRVGRSYRRMFTPGTRPSLVLAHSRRDLSAEFRQSVVAESVRAEAGYAPGEEGAAAACSAWLADNRKKALLAQVGVGTIDQALLAVLNVRHQSLRALGLVGKVLVVDEVHACDAYQNRLLEQLLRLHAAQGGSATLLSATLPLETRRKLVRAFAEGAGFEPPGQLREAYPCLLAISREGSEVVPTEPPPWARRELGFELVHDPERAMEWLAARARSGACACWVRNTVRDAVGAYDRLVERLGPERVTLFHGRFVLGHRLEIEDRVLKRFGKESGPAERAGHVVVATQVIEQSLDLDFDEMISDLAPVDLLLQRAGRLRRHRRDEAGERIEAPDRRGTPVLRVLSPKPVDDPDEGWIRSFLPGTSFVYPHAGELWRTARLLARSPTARLPDHSRKLVEAVFGDSGEPIPEGLAPIAVQAEGRRRADASAGELNAHTFELGYGGGLGSWTDDEDGRTRLGEPSVTLRLARWDGTRLLPMAETGPDPWRLSEVSVRRSQVAAPADPADAALNDAVTRHLDRRSTARPHYELVPMTAAGDGWWKAGAFDATGRPRTLIYRPDRGLEVT